jgi:DNA-binding cell septation regulator SpoVG
VVEVESIKPINGAGNLKAFAIINVSGKLRISDVRVIQQPNQQAWVSMPSRAYEKDGHRKWAPTVEILDEALKQQITAVVLAEFAKTAAPGSKQSTPEGW